MKKRITTILLCLPILVFGQSRIDTLFDIADDHFEYKEYTEAKTIYEGLKLELKKGTNDYIYAANQIAMIYFFQREDLRQAGQYQEAITYLKEFINYLESEKAFLQPFWYEEKRYFLYKSIIQNYFSLGELEQASAYQNLLYEAYKRNELPEGIKMYYSFEMFKWEDKNVWGYEWFPELGDPETEGSFSKIVYYIYSTDENGKDKEQLYRLHVLKVHKIDQNMPDYVLTKRSESPTEELSGSYGPTLITHLLITKN